MQVSVFDECFDRVVSHTHTHSANEFTHKLANINRPLGVKNIMKKKSALGLFQWMDTVICNMLWETDNKCAVWCTFWYIYIYRQDSRLYYWWFKLYLQRTPAIYNSNISNMKDRTKQINRNNYTTHNTPQAALCSLYAETTPPPPKTDSPFTNRYCAISKLFRAKMRLNCKRDRADWANRLCVALDELPPPAPSPPSPTA